MLIYCSMNINIIKKKINNRWQITGTMKIIINNKLTHSGLVYLYEVKKKNLLFDVLKVSMNLAEAHVIAGFEI